MRNRLLSNYHKFLKNSGVLKIKMKKCHFFFICMISGDDMVTTFADEHLSNVLLPEGLLRRRGRVQKTCPSGVWIFVSFIEPGYLWR